jgi:biopolymer transport protein ExbD
MAMSAGKSRGAIAEINVTPMADVMIVLLIIFMVTVPIIDRQSVSLPPAAHVKDEHDAGKALVLVLETSGDLTIDEHRVGPFEPALAQVTELAQADPLRAVWIKADRGVRYGWVGSLLEACRRGGADNLKLATNRPEVR